MNVVFDARCVFRGKGGIGRYARGLLEALAQIDSDHDMTVLLPGVAPPDDVELPARFAQRVVPAVMIDQAWEQFQLPSLLGWLGSDVYFNPCFAAPVLADCPRVATVHDVVFERHPELVEPRLRTYLQRAARLAAGHAERIVTVSSFSRDEICDVYGLARERVHVIHNGIDARFHPMRLSEEQARQIRTQLHLPGEAPFLAYVGAIEPKKNIENLLRAYGQAHRRIPHRLVLAGGQGGKRWSPERLIRELGLEDSVRLVGYVPDEMVVELMCLSDGFVYPSLYEGFGLPPLEAMACGKPTLVSNVSSLPEVVGEGALTVDPHDVGALADGIERIATDVELREQLSQQGQQRANQFTWPCAAARLLALLSEAGNGRSVQQSEDVDTATAGLAAGQAPATQGLEPRE